MTRIKTSFISGFALLEMICVLMLVSVLMALGLTGVTPDDSSLTTASATLRSHLRYAQQMATANTGSAFEVSFSGVSYTLLQDGVATACPGDNVPVHPLSDGMTVKVMRISSGVVTSLVFTPQGAIQGGNHEIALTLTTPAPTAWTGNTSFVVIGNTGYIP